MHRLLLVLLMAAPVFAQIPFAKNYVTIGGGAGIPGGELKPFLDTSPVLRVGYGYRFLRNFQADIGFDTVFYAANIKDYQSTQFGDLRIRDFQFMLPLGGRAVLPLASERLLLYAGGGGAYLRYQERVRQPFSGTGYRIDCPTCRSRSGWGYYGLLGMAYALDRNQHFRIGFTTRVYRATTSGDAFGPLPAFSTKDQWVNTAAEFTVSF